MNRNEQVNGEKMWEYISNMGKAIKKYRTGIGVGAIITVMPFISSCAEFWQESYKELAKINDGTQTQSTSYDTSYNDSYWRMQHSINELERIKREAAWDTTRINAASRKILYEMELQKKLKELERQQREMQRQR